MSKPDLIKQAFLEAKEGFEKAKSDWYHSGITMVDLYKIIAPIAAVIYQQLCHEAMLEEKDNS